MTKFFTSDSHFNHSNIIKYCNRPFSSVKEMNNELIRRWNRKVGINDTVYHLGDFAFNMKFQDMLELFKSLNGKKILVKGNHDHKDTLKLPWELKKEIIDTNFGTTHVVLCHYPIEDWNRRMKGSIHLHGHCHGSLSGSWNRFDVGVDCFNYEPQSEEELLAHSEMLTKRVA